MVSEATSIEREQPFQLRGYGVAIGCVIVAVALTTFFPSVIEPSVFSFFLAAVMLSAWYGGLGPGLLATIIGVVVIESFFIPTSEAQWGIHVYVRFAIFTLVAVLISSLTGARKRAEHALRKAHAELELRVQERTAKLAEANQSLRVEIKERERTEQENQKLLSELAARVKELTALHYAAHLLQDENKTPDQLLHEIVELLPAACQRPDATGARIGFDGAEYVTTNFGSGLDRVERSDFTTLGGKHGHIEVGYARASAVKGEEGFSTEEKRLIESLAEMLQSYFQRKEAASQVAQVSRDLIESNRELWRLQSEIKRVEPLAALGRITGTIAHELGTPLNSVLGYAQLIAQDGLSESARRRLDIVKTQVERMVDIINHYLTNVRSSFQKQDRISINALIQDTLVLLKPIFQQHRIEVKTELAESLPSLLADGPSLQRVLINLFDNSIDAIQERGAVTVATQSCAASGSKPAGLVITVSDTGAGISPEILPKVFNMFVTTKAPGKGSGLGLAISQEIVKGHGGEIEMTSVVGKGACARVFLPSDDNGTDSTMTGGQA
jgi:signal transduction histidine kinase